MSRLVLCFHTRAVYFASFYLRKLQDTCEIKGWRKLRNLQCGAVKDSLNPYSYVTPVCQNRASFFDELTQAIDSSDSFQHVYINVFIVFISYLRVVFLSTNVWRYRCVCNNQYSMKCAGSTIINCAVIQII